MGSVSYPLFKPWRSPSNLPSSIRSAKDYLQSVWRLQCSQWEFRLLQLDPERKLEACLNNSEIIRFGSVCQHHALALSNFSNFRHHSFLQVTTGRINETLLNTARVYPT